MKYIIFYTSTNYIRTLHLLIFFKYHLNIYKNNIVIQIFLKTILSN